MKHWKSISATLLAATLVTSTAGQAWADETEKVDSSTFETVDLQEALENVKDETVTSDDLEVISSIVPVGYIANNITALSLNLEKISNPRAKEALQKNIDRAIARWEAKNKVEEETEVETPEEEAEVEVETPVVIEPPIVELPTTEEEATPVTVVSEDTVEEETEDEEKTDAEKEAKKAEQLAKKEAKKAEIAAKKEAKKAEKAARKEAKKAEKEERKANKEAKHENKGKKDNE